MILDKLLQKLIELKTSDMYPFHMPGHKRNPEYPYFREAFGLDITEIDGYGDLYADEGILEELKLHAAKVYGAKWAYILVNGSTVGVLSAISAAVGKGGRILIAKEAHRSAYNAAFLKELQVEDTDIDLIEPYGIGGGVDPEDVAEKLDRYPDTEAVFITSPTYRGIISDLRGIARVCHDRDKLLIVDSAHGAYLGFEEDSIKKYKTDNAVRSGADIIVESLHKTLPCFTQTALMFVNSDRVDEELLGRYLSIYQTSSPSYLFMAGISACLEFLEKPGDRFKVQYREIEKLRNMAEDFENIKIAGRELIGQHKVYGLDPFRFVIHHEKISGEGLYGLLSGKYHLICELSTPGHVLAMTSPLDTEQGFRRLCRALEETDKDWKN